MSVMKKNAQEYDEFEMSKIVTNDAPFRYRVSAQRPVHQPDRESSDTVYLDR